MTAEIPVSTAARSTISAARSRWLGADGALIYFLFRLLGKLQSLGTVTAIDWSAYAAIVTPRADAQARIDPSQRGRDGSYGRVRIFRGYSFTRLWKGRLNMNISAFFADLGI
jgi:hypothetical protein